MEAFQEIPCLERIDGGSVEPDGIRIQHGCCSFWLLLVHDFVVGCCWWCCCNKMNIKNCEYDRSLAVNYYLNTQTTVCFDLPARQSYSTLSLRTANNCYRTCR
jgi:hypothetical protein